jgi:predicted ATPase
MQIPSTVQNLLADRIDRLPLEEKHLLQTAAVIGVTVPFGLLRDVVELPEEALYQQLSTLQTGEFLYESILFPELEYRFKHALTNEVAYAALLHDRKRALHARIFHVLEKRVGENVLDYVETLAHHAYSGELWDRAVFYLAQAGAKALACSASREAATSIKRALAVVEQLPESRQKLERRVKRRTRTARHVAHRKRGLGRDGVQKALGRCRHSFDARCRRSTRVFRLSGIEAWTR